MQDKRIFTVGAVVAAVVGLAASVAAAVDDLSPAAQFCAESGCATVRSSAFARPLGIPMSVLGLGFFATMVALAFWQRPRARRVLAVAGGAWAVYLIALQAFVIDAWCKLCLVADPSAIVLAVCVVGGARTLEPRAKRLVALVPALAAAVLALGAWTRLGGEPAREVGEMPAFVARAQAPYGVTIVEVVDFECPFCREMQKRLDTALQQTDRHVTLVRKMFPLPNHRGAIPAAIAWCCAEAQGKGDAMARALFEADPKELTRAGCEKIAERIGCDMQRFAADVPAAKQRVINDLQEARAAEIHGLPTLFIRDVRVNGLSLTSDELREVIEEM